MTKNMDPGKTTYNEKLIAIPTGKDDEKVEYRVWNPFRSKLGASILAGIKNVYIKPGIKLLYLGASFGTTVSHCSDIVGENGVVYAVEFSPRAGRELLTVARRRSNIVPIVEDARHPHKYRMLVSMCDVVFSDVAQPDQSRICALNAQWFLKAGGHLVYSVKANCIDSTAAAADVFAAQVEQLRKDGFTPEEQVGLEPYERDHCVIIAEYRKDQAAGADDGSSD